MLVVFFMFGFVAAGLIAGLAAMATAPTGYQDETGFHYGHPCEEVKFPLGLPQLELAYIQN